MSGRDGNDVAIEDVRQILAALGLGTHARPYSAHEVVQREVLPALQRLVAEAAEARRLRVCVECRMPSGRHWDTCPNRHDGRPTR